MVYFYIVALLFLCNQRTYVYYCKSWPLLSHLLRTQFTARLIVCLFDESSAYARSAAERNRVDYKVGEKTAAKRFQRRHV